MGTADERATGSPGGARRYVPADFGFGHLHEIVGDAVITGDATLGTIVLFNPAAQRMFGYSESEALGMLIEDLVPGPLKERHRQGIAQYAATGKAALVGTGQATELPARRKDGSELWIELTLSAIDAVDVPGRFVLAIVRDTTERRRSQIELAAYADQLATANRSMREFMLMAAHDLRSPLTTIILASGEIAAGPNVPDDVSPLIGMIVRQAHRMELLIADLADLGAIEAGDIEPHPVDLAVGGAVSEALETAGLAPDDVRCDVPDDLRVWTDPQHLSRMLTNYLVNAAKYGETGLTVHARRAGNAVDVVVADAGPGVPDGFEPRLFDKFSRGGNTRLRPGHGLGLAIVAGLAKVNQGTAWHEPNEPTGARFYLRLPTPA
jgi:PAS domain S-box-containing protein